MTPRATMLKRVRGIGEQRAQRIVETYGDDLDTVLSDPDKIEEVAGAIIGKPEPTIHSRHIAAELVAEWKNRLEPEYKAAAFLESHGVDSSWLAVKIARLLGAKAEEVLTNNPYTLSRVLEWAQMDEIGQKVILRRYEAADALRAPERLLGAVDSAMSDALSLGHTAVNLLKLRHLVKAKLSCDDATASEAIDLADSRNHILKSGNVVRSPGAAWMEGEIRDRFRAMAQVEKSFIWATADWIEGAINAWVAKQSPKPSDEQVAAIQHVLERQISVISGGAGTGKTTTMRGVVEVWEDLGGRVQLCTLSGKASLRLSQATHRLAKTVHRTIRELELRETYGAEGRPMPEDFALFDDSTLVIVDEASMVDLGMFCKLVHKMPQGCRLLMTGDVAQLPPIGPGIVFHEAAKVKAITSRLTKVFRQAEGNGIPAVANAIRDLKMPELCEFDGPAEGVSIVPCHVDQIDAKVDEVVTKLGGFQAGNHELQILAALNKRCDGLNARFHKQRSKQTITEIQGHLGNYFSPGDPVVFLSNDYKRALFNGLLGHVKLIDDAYQTMYAEFDGQEHFFRVADLIDIGLAYSLSCHKLQGSQAERVVIVLEPNRLMEPSWLYTAITRAEQQAVLVGVPSVIEKALEVTPAWQQRHHGFNLSQTDSPKGAAA